MACVMADKVAGGYKNLRGRRVRVKKRNGWRVGVVVTHLRNNKWQIAFPDGERETFHRDEFLVRE